MCLYELVGRTMRPQTVHRVARRSMVSRAGVRPPCLAHTHSLSCTARLIAWTPAGCVDVANTTSFATCHGRGKHHRRTSVDPPIAALRHSSPAFQGHPQFSCLDQSQKSAKGLSFQRYNTWTDEPDLRWSPRSAGDNLRRQMVHVVKKPTSRRSRHLQGQTATTCHGHHRDGGAQKIAPQ